MDQLFSLFGSIALIGSIPLAIFFIVKTKYEKYENICIIIVRTLALHIGNNTYLSIYDVYNIIKSKYTENKIKENFIKDLIYETISCPVIENEKKELIINNLRMFYTKTDINEFIDSLENKKIDNDKINSFNKNNFANFNILLNDKLLKKEIEERYSCAFSYFLSAFKLLAFIITGIFSILTISENFLFKKTFNFMYINNLTILKTILLSILVSILASFLSGLYIKFMKKINMKKFYCMLFQFIFPLEI